MRKRNLIIIILLIILIIIIGIIIYSKIYLNNIENTIQVKVIAFDNNEVEVKIEQDKNLSSTKLTTLKLNKEIVITYLNKKIKYENLNKYLQKDTLMKVTFKEKDISKTQNITKINITKVPYDFSIVVYLDKDVTENEITLIGTKIKEIEGIDSIKFKSKEEVKQEMSETSEKLNEVIENLDNNPFYDTYIVTLSSLENEDEIIASIEKINKVYHVKY